MVDEAKISIGVLGCGSIGSELALSVGPQGIGNARVVAVADQDTEAAAALAGLLPGDVTIHADASDLISGDADLIVECASPAVVKAFGPSVLKAGKSILLMSSGGLLDVATFTNMSLASQANGGEIIVPSGAVGGIDALRATRDHLDFVTIVSTKKPEALVGAPGFADWEDCEITSPTTIYEGPAIKAVSLFPANVNVAATVSLAGIGPTETQVRVIADPESPGNVHEVRAQGQFGELNLKFINQPHVTNPKTSYLAILAAIEALRSFCEPGPRIGT